MRWRRARKRTILKKSSQRQSTNTGPIHPLRPMSVGDTKTTATGVSSTMFRRADVSDNICLCYLKREHVGGLVAAGKRLVTKAGIHQSLNQPVSDAAAQSSFSWRIYRQTETRWIPFILATKTLWLAPRLTFHPKPPPLPATDRHSIVTVVYRSNNEQFPTYNKQWCWF